MSKILPVELPKKNFSMIHSNSVPVIGVIGVDWEHVSGELIVSQIDVGRSLLALLGGGRELKRAEYRLKGIIADIGGAIGDNPDRDFLIRLDLPEYEVLREFQPQLLNSGVELVPGISQKLRKRLIANQTVFSDEANLSMIEFYLNLFFERRKRVAQENGKIVVDTIKT